MGGGLLRDPERIDQPYCRPCGKVANAPLTVKTRIGFEDAVQVLLESLICFHLNHQVELVSLHARTVKGGYREVPQYDFVKRAVKTLGCPVLLNGDVHTPYSAITLCKKTGATGVMIGRGAIRNPWIFRQIKELHLGKAMFRPTLGDVYNYINDLFDVFSNREINEQKQVARLKKFLNFIGLGVDENGKFLHLMRRTKIRSELDAVCRFFLLDNNNSIKPMSLKPYTGLVARPGTEGSDCHTKSDA